MGDVDYFVARFPWRRVLLGFVGFPFWALTSLPFFGVNPFPPCLKNSMKNIVATVIASIADATTYDNVDGICGCRGIVVTGAGVELPGEDSNKPTTGFPGRVNATVQAAAFTLNVFNFDQVPFWRTYGAIRDGGVLHGYETAAFIETFPVLALIFSTTIFVRFGNWLVVFVDCVTFSAFSKKQEDPLGITLNEEPKWPKATVNDFPVSFPHSCWPVRLPVTFIMVVL